ncbi:MAG TPA: GDP-mannose 4,6-dehydratase [Terriglobales bacterium]|jgi:GDP-4-dehydro-6-deoxy-D-mannose reductase|nr:GDP-mannose 4,6-dehydratase [Terriglobales bacterium]
MKRVAFVTGAEGFIGSHMVRFLAAEGWDVIGGQRLHATSVSKLKNVKFVQCELANGQQVERVFQEYQPTHVFHLGAQSLPTVSWADPVGTFESNIMGSLHVFEAIRHQKRRPIVVSACSSAEYGNVPPSAIPVREEQPLRPLHPYGISKVCLDLLAREYFLDYQVPAVNIRLFNTTGPGKTNDAPSDFVRQLIRIKKGLQKPVIEVGNLKPRRAFLDVQDTVRGFYLAAMKGHRGEAYNLCAATTYEIDEILRFAIELSGLKVEVRPAASLMRPSDEKIIFGSTKKIRKHTGWKPTFTIKQTLTSMLEYWDRTI